MKDLQTTRDALANLVKENLKKSIRKENLSTFRNEFETENSSAIELLNEALMDVAVAIGRAAIVETDILDEEKTAVAIQQASTAVEPTRILQGQIIVQEGEVISREVYRQLELLGMIDNQTSIKPIIGLVILILLQMSFLFILFDRSKQELTKKRNALLDDSHCVCQLRL